ncbi:sugar transporter [Pseudogemmobacter humi]|uniref:sugar transporter n=1 Tax=Pseudogemmobacter humi TaxID=2483812 RepID=UPI001F29A604|nr:sugar transporter [Pseudogemmobacter humi]
MPTPQAETSAAVVPLKPVGQPVPASGAAPRIGSPVVGPGPRLVPPVAPAPAVPGQQMPDAPPPARRSRMRPRHYGLIASFLALVAAPVAAAAIYLWAIAEDQYASYLGFSVHREDGSPALALFSGLSSISGSGSSSDTDILYEFIFSQQLVADVDAEIGLREIWSKPGFDPVFAYSAPGTIEDLKDYWEDMVSVYYDSTTRLIEVRALAFTPGDAQKITEAIYKRSTKIINDLNDVATEDAVRFAAEDLRLAEEGVREARSAMTTFRQRHQLIDPSTELAAQASVIAALQEQLVSAQVELELLEQNTIANDPRLETVRRRIKVISERIAAERRKFGISSGDETPGESEALASIFSDYERLLVDREFAENAYVSARAAYEAALIEARRQSRYLAAHVLPTQAESARFPERGKLLGLAVVFVGMLWSIATLLFYSLRDRR